MPSQAVVEAVSGGLGACTATWATYPLKTIYTLQAVTAKGDGSAASALTVLDVLQKYGITGLYPGIGPNLVESALSSAVYFYFYSKFKALVLQRGVQSPKGQAGVGPQPPKRQEFGVLASLLVATAAGACNQLTTLPASTVATRMQVQQPSAKTANGEPAAPVTTWGCIVSLLREEGVFGFWKGLLPSMVLLANPAMQYMLYEQLLTLMRRWKARRMTAAAAAARKQLAQMAPCVAADQQRAAAKEAAMAMLPAAGAAPPRRRTVDSDELVDDSNGAENGKPAAVAMALAPQSQPVEVSPQDVRLSAGEVFLASALAKIGATVVTYPLIVIKSRLQASSGKGGQARYTGTWDAIAKTAREEGMGGFFKGLEAKILQTALNAALMLMIKEQLSAATRAALDRSSSRRKAAMEAAAAKAAQAASAPAPPAPLAAPAASSSTASSVAAAAAAVAREISSSVAKHKDTIISSIGK